MNDRATKSWTERYFAGWPLGLALVLAAVLTAVLVVPRPVPPRELPLPVVDGQEQREQMERERARAAEARAGLPYEVRAVGELVRRYGYAREVQPEHAPTLKKQLTGLVRAAREQHGDAALLALRALQAELFVSALRAQAGAAGPTREVRELGGPLGARAAHPTWFDANGFVGSDEEARVLFRMRWNELVGVMRRQPFAPTLNEWRAYYRFVLAHAGDGLGGASAPEPAIARALTALAELDPDYPIDFARGVLAYRQGAYAAAAAAFSAHLEQHPDGPWTQRAKNHLAACGQWLQQ